VFLSGLRWLTRATTALLLASWAAPGAADVPVDAAVLAQVDAKGSAQVIVQLHEDAGSRRAAGLAARRAAVRFIQDRALSALVPGDLQIGFRYQVVNGFSGRLSRAGLARLRRSPAVASIQYDRVMSASLAEAGPLIGAPSVHTQLGFTGKGINVAVLDTGIDSDHPDLSDNIVAQKCFCNLNGLSCCPGGADSAEDNNGHGTHVSGIITGKGTVAPKGIAPDAGIVAVKVLNGNGTGDTSGIIAAADWVAANAAALKIRIANLSLGIAINANDDCPNADGAPGMASLIQAGIAVFAASGNSGTTNGISTPACAPGVISVGATFDATQTYQGALRQVDSVAPFSESGPNLDLLGPGAMITSAYPDKSQNTLPGTSFASPAAAAVGALVLERNPGLSREELEEVLAQTGKPITDGRNGLVRPRVDALAAVDAVGCTGKANGTPCENGDLCTVGDTCQNETCVAGSPKLCDSAGICLAPGACDPATGACGQGPARPNGTVCTASENRPYGGSCQSGTCVDAGVAGLPPSPDENPPAPGPEDEPNLSALPASTRGGCSTGFGAAGLAWLGAALAAFRRRSP
jgi:hypothetical protein